MQHPACIEWHAIANQFVVLWIQNQIGRIPFFVRHRVFPQHIRYTTIVHWNKVDPNQFINIFRILITNSNQIITYLSDNMLRRNDNSVRNRLKWFVLSILNHAASGSIKVYIQIMSINRIFVCFGLPCDSNGLFIFTFALAIISECSVWIIHTYTDTYIQYEVGNERIIILFLLLFSIIFLFFIESVKYSIFVCAEDRILSQSNEKIYRSSKIKYIYLFQARFRDQWCHLAYRNRMSMHTIMP